jgi:hypothetical protein
MERGGYTKKTIRELERAIAKALQARNSAGLLTWHGRDVCGTMRRNFAISHLGQMR